MASRRNSSSGVSTKKSKRFAGNMSAISVNDSGLGLNITSSYMDQSSITSSTAAANPAFTEDQILIRNLCAQRLSRYINQSCASDAASSEEQKILKQRSEQILARYNLQFTAPNGTSNTESTKKIIPSFPKISTPVQGPVVNKASARSSRSEMKNSSCGVEKLPEKVTPVRIDPSSAITSVIPVTVTSTANMAVSCDITDITQTQVSADVAERFSERDTQIVPGESESDTDSVASENLSEIIWKNPDESDSDTDSVESENLSEVIWKNPDESDCDSDSIEPEQISTWKDPELAEIDQTFVCSQELDESVSDTAVMEMFGRMFTIPELEELLQDPDLDAKLWSMMLAQSCAEPETPCNYQPKPKRMITSKPKKSTKKKLGRFVSGVVNTMAIFF